MRNALLFLEAELSIPSTDSNISMALGQTLFPHFQFSFSDIHGFGDRHDELKKDHYFQKKIHPYPYFLQKIHDMDGNIRQTSLPRNACSHLHGSTNPAQQRITI